MALFRNTKNRYGWVAMLFHWAMALLILAMLGLGLYMDGLPVSLAKLKLYGWHKELGILILFLVVLRTVWSCVNIVPVLPPPYWQQLAARALHLAFYGFMFVLPITGWCMSSASGVPVSFFGLFVLPDFVAPNKQLGHLFRVVHGWLAYGLIAAIVSHAAAALWHHFIQNDDTVRRMLP